MAGEDSRRKLVDFLDRRAFEPVLKADPSDYPEGKHEKLNDVQEATRNERERFQNYDSAEEVYRMYRDDLSSEPARRIHRELNDLGLPTLVDVQGEFEELASDLGVTR